MTQVEYMASHTICCKLPYKKSNRLPSHNFFSLQKAQELLWPQKFTQLSRFWPSFEADRHHSLAKQQCGSSKAA